jgi:hypothetical protein
MATETTMGDLIASVKTLLQSQIGSGGTLYGVHQIKRGILPNNVQFPVVTIIPEDEQIVKIKGRCATVRRDLTIYLFVRNRSRADTIKLQEHADAIMEVLRADRQLLDGGLSPTIYHIELSEIDYDQDRTGAEMMASYYSEETLPVRTVDTTINDNPSIGSIANEIQTTLNGLKATTLAGVSQIIRENWGEVASRRLPAITVESEGQSNIAHEAGREQISCSFNINIFSKVASAADSTLVSHLALLEPVKDALLSNATWNGTCYDSGLLGISFNSTASDDEMLYQTELRYATKSRHAI